LSRIPHSKKHSEKHSEYKSHQILILGIKTSTIRGMIPPWGFCENPWISDPDPDLADLANLPSFCGGPAGECRGHGKIRGPGASHLHLGRGGFGGLTGQFLGKIQEPWKLSMLGFEAVIVTFPLVNDWSMHQN